ncbi:MAG TPA: TonB-dependent receptor [Chitinophagaceae bacterium]|nr:TonB-dependent receptor [Chitinophagaceae bacterium]
MKTCFSIISFLIFFSTHSYAQRSKSAADTVVSFKVFGVCEMCKDRIEGALKVRGISSAEWNVDSKLLSLRYDPSKTTIEKIHNKIASVGHDTHLKKAKDAVYNALPACCKHREIDSMDDLQGGAHASPLNQAADTTKITNILADSIRGVVLEEDSKGLFKPLQGASVLWLGSREGTVTNEQGFFSLVRTDARLVISYTGFKADTISVGDNREVKVILATGKALNEVKVTSSRRATYINGYDPFRTAIITEKELFKAACCNLSESFETNPSVDVSYNDAVTGSKQIQLLGLAGIYTQLTVENLPGPRGLATSLGLNSIPGTWIESIQLNKGTGSVVNGFESIAGQINVELKKPATSEKVYANIYVNDFGRTDVNLNLTKQLNKKWATTLLLHNDYYNNRKLDFNKDGFRDLPTGNLVSIINRWSFEDGKGFMSQFGVKFLDDRKTGGQVNYLASRDKLQANNYGLGINSRRVEAFGKLGYVFPQKKYQSLGLQLAAFSHKTDSYFGLTTYNAQQENFYSNLIYQSIINNTAHKFRTGLSFSYDRYNEDFKGANYKRTELVPGAFFEYTFTPSPKFDLVAGIREDHNSLYGWFTTPRLHARYEPVKGTIIRASIGRGQRTANILAENNGVFASSRELHIIGQAASGAYGLNPEIAWNKGISVDQKFNLFKRSATLGLDFFRNDFQNQVVVDIEDAGAVKFYNLQGESYSNSFQTELSFIPVQHLDVRLAYRLFDVKTTYDNRLLQKTLTAQNRAFANVAYEMDRWKLDYTFSYSDKKRLPSTASNPLPFQRASYSPSFVTMNAQISKTLGKKNQFDIYVGGENLTNYYQENAIVAANEPFGSFFDASMIWGPLTGRMIYTGVRFKIQ